MAKKHDHPRPIHRTTGMIKNERQYHITKAQAEKFEQTFLALEKQGQAKGAYLLLHQAHLNALKSQRGSLRQELAECLGLKEQQVQKYEATEYASASIARVRDVIAAFGVTVKKKVALTR